MNKSETIARLAAASFAIVFMLAAATGAFAQISEYDEPTQGPPSSVISSPDEPEAPQPARSQRPSPPPAPALPVQPSRGEFQYTVRAGDSLGSVASAFGLQAADLAAANHMDADTVLYIGRILRIPNPFAAQVRALTAQVDRLQAESNAASRKTDAAIAHNRDLKADLQSLQDENKSLQYSVRMLPWWHGMALTAVIGALLLLGITLLTLFQWWILRQRFAALADLSESLSRLDHKYKSLLAKAELRFQQLYGRRRQGSDGLDHGKTQEEIEIERLSIELRDALETHLRRLGFARARSRRRAGASGDLIGGVDATIEARSARR
jgi:LysM repeat protein